MAQTALTPITPKGPYPGTVSAGDLAIAFTASDVANGNKWAFSGRDILLVQNSNAGAQTFTISSTADERGRKADIATYSVPAGGFAAFFISSATGWTQADGTILLATSHANIQFAVVRC
jgi:hypothetical protein